VWCKKFRRYIHRRNWPLIGWGEVSFDTGVTILVRKGQWIPFASTYKQWKMKKERKNSSWDLFMLVEREGGGVVLVPISGFQLEVAMLFLSAQLFFLVVRSSWRNDPLHTFHQEKVMTMNDNHHNRANHGTWPLADQAAATSLFLSCWRCRFTPWWRRGFGCLGSWIYLVRGRAR